VVRTVEVGGDDASPGLGVCVNEFGRNGDPSRVNQDVTGTDSLVGFAHRPAARSLVGYVGVNTNSVRGEQGLELSRLISRADQGRDSCAFSDECLNDGGSDPLPRPTDQRDLALEGPPANALSHA
jgi:hypothetical protein